MHRVINPIDVDSEVSDNCIVEYQEKCLSESRRNGGIQG